MIYTARIKYYGEDRLDITVKSANDTGRYFAPTWDMVLNFKKKLITWEEYTQQYYTLLQERRLQIPKEIDPVIGAIARQALDNSVTFVCYCTNPNTCHRGLLAYWFVSMYPQLEYAGERSLI